MKKYIILILLVCIGGMGIFILYTYNPSAEAVFPQCPFLRLTGYQCPGCGTQRALHAVVHGDIATAFRYNPLFLLFIPYLLGGLYVAFLGGNVRFPNFARICYGKYAAIVVLAIILLYGVGRNIW